MTSSPLAYIAAPLFNEAERAFNLRLSDFVQSTGFRTYLPQLDGGLYSELVREGMEPAAARRMLFDADICAIRDAAVLLLLMDGRTIDEGACFELALAYAFGKRCVGFKTDSRSLLRGEDSLMICGALEYVARDWTTLNTRLSEIRSEMMA